MKRLYRPINGRRDIVLAAARMDTGNHEGEDGCLGATLPTRNPGAPSTPSRPLRYHSPRPQQHSHHPLGHGHGHGHDHGQDSIHDRESTHDHAQIFFLHASHHQPSAIAAVGASRATPMTATATSTTLDDSVFGSHVASNRNAAYANAVTIIEPNGFPSPDNFYRLDLDNLMASTLPVPRHDQDASLRSDGSSPVPRHPAIPSTRPGMRPSIRSVSAPVEDGLPARSRPAAPSTLNARSGHQPSVKDLTRKFDQNATRRSSNTVHKTTRIPTRETQRPEANGQVPCATGRSSASDSSAGVLSASPAARSTQQHRTESEDNSSSNSQSFASRIAKPRGSLGTRSQTSKSMTTLTPALTPVLSSTSVPSLSQSRGLLFGEVGPAELNAGLAGHGIDELSARRTREANAQGTLGRRQRSFSHTDAEPSSPSDWYRSSRGEPGDAGNVGANVLHPTPKHSRSRSELGFAKPVQEPPTTARSSRPKPTLDTSVLTAASKIPISIRKYNTPSTSSSPNSTRSNSPSTIRRPVVQGKRMHASPNQGPKVPSPLASPAMKRRNRPSAITPSGNTRLNAYISTPLPKLSPPLRSSRPRQPVSAATTISSRIKAIERDKSPSKKETRANTRGNEPATRRRKISMGPIDYESRREQIKLSYTKSLRESEVRVATRKAAEKKRREVEAKALADQIAAAEALKCQEEDVQIDLIRGNAEDSVEANTAVVEPQTLRLITPDSVIESPTNEGESALGLPPLRTIAADILHSEISAASDNPRQEGKGSPALEIPGSFPGAENTEDMDEAPPSAISNTTEFDNEPQTDPPVQEAPLADEANEALSAVDEDAQSIYRKSEYRSPFEDETTADDGLSIKIALDASPDSLATPENPSDSMDDIGVGQEVPVTSQEEAYEYVPLLVQPYETKVTILGREAGFTPPVIETQSASSFTPAPEQQYPEDSVQHHVYTSLNFSDKNSNQSDVEQVEPSSGLSEIAEFFIGPSLQQHQRLQSSTATQADATTGADIEATSVQQDSDDLRYSLDSKRTLGTRPSLTVPRTSESMNRASQTTVWTDFSMNSQDSSSGYGPTDRDSQRVGFTWREALADSDTDSRSESYRFSRNSMAISNSRDVSPCGTYQEPELYETQHQLPEIDTGEEFAAAVLSRQSSLRSLAIPVLPSHSPPPPPDNISFRDGIGSAPPSEYYDETRPNSYVHNENDDDVLVLVDSLKQHGDFDTSESTTQSIDQGSLAASEGPQSTSSRLTSQQTLAESMNVEQVSDLPPKEKKRLFTRLETIKELIDTETFFIRDMNIVEEIYKGTAEACPKLDDKTIKLIFRNTDKIIQFHSAFLVELKAGVSSIYTPRTHRHVQKDTSNSSNVPPSLSGVSAAATGQLNDAKDRETSLGPTFIQNIENMKQVHETFLKNSDHAAKRLIQIQEDPTVQVWLNECNEVARELTRAWNLDSLLIKPMQRITKYPNLLIQLLHETPMDHPDRPALEAAKTALENAIEEINKTKKNFELVGQIVGRRRKESDVKAGFARAFGKRVDKLQATSYKPSEDAEYLKLHEKFGDDYLRLQVVLRDVEYYARTVGDQVHEFLQYLSSMELVMRLQPSPHPEIESKWVRFNVSMRDIEKIALEQHVSHIPPRHVFSALLTWFDSSHKFGSKSLSPSSL